MRVLYDHQAFTYQYFGGVSKCFCELISHLPADILPIIAIKESNNIHLKESGLVPILKPVSMDRKTFIEKYRFKGKGFLYKHINTLFPYIHTTENFNKKNSIINLKENKYDIFHPTFFDDYYLPYINNRPFVLTIHDMMPELFPEYFKRNDIQILNKKKLVNKAAAIVAVSKKTKDDIIDILNVSPQKIHVIYHGGPQIEFLKDNKQPTFPYFLYVGQRDAYKNFKQLLIDFSRFVSIHQDVKLICTGPPFTKDETILIENYKIKENIVHIQASSKELKSLYANALAFIYPSLYEGFGMPILEAYAYGCPVLLNNKSCFPEIGGNAAIYFESDNTKSNLYDKLVEIINFSMETRKYYIDKGYKRLRLYSWTKAANELANLYRSLV